MNTKHAAVLAVFLILASSLCIPLAARDSYGAGDLETGTQSNPLDRLYVGESDIDKTAGKTFYVKNGGSVSVVGFVDESETFSCQVLSVTTGYGLIAENDGLYGTLSKVGTATANVWYVNGSEDQHFTFSIVSVATSAPTTSYTVTFNANGGSVSPASKTYNGTAITLPTPTWANHTFDGWFTSANGGTRASSPYIPTANITLYAHWTEIPQQQQGLVTGSQSNPLDNLYVSGTEIDETSGLTFYVKNGGTVAVEGFVDESGTFGYQVTQVTTGYGLNADDDGLYGTLGKTGTVTVTVRGWNGSSVNDEEFTFTIVSVASSVTAHIVTLNPNGGSVSPAEITYTGTPLSLPTPSRAGWTFLGWWTAQTGGTQVRGLYQPQSNVTLWAHWEHEQTGVHYTVTLDPNGGSVSPVQLTYEGTALVLPTPTRSGYTFNGWWDTYQSTQYYSPFTATGDMTLRASWLKNFTLTFVTDSSTPWGSVSPSTLTVPAYSQITVNGNVLTVNGQIATATPSSSSQGYSYSFAGWSSNATGGVTDDMRITASFARTADHTVTVQVSPFESWGSVSKTTFTVPHGTTVTQQSNHVLRFSNGVSVIPTAAAEEDGFKFFFQSWTAPDVINDNAIISANFNWRASDGYRIISFQTSGEGTLNGNKIISVPDGSTITQSGNSITIAGKTVTAVPASGYTFVRWDGATPTVTMSKDITAVFEPIQNYVVTLNANGGSVSPTSMTYTGTALTLPTPTWSNHTFQGWYTSASGGTQAGSTYTPTANVTLYAHWTDNTPATTDITLTIAVNPAGSGSVKQSGSAVTSITVAGGQVTIASNGNLTIGGKTLTPVPDTGYRFSKWTYRMGDLQNGASLTGSQTITAVFVEAPVVTLNANGGSVSPTSMTYTGTALTLPTPTRSGYTFNGWWTAQTGGTQVSGAYTPTANVTLYAHWTETQVTLTITISPTNGGTVKLGTYNVDSITVAPRSTISLDGNSLTINGKTLTATPATGKQFSKWTLSGLGDVSNGMTIGTNNLTLTAVFTDAPHYTVTLNANGGSVSPTSMTYAGTALTLPTPTWSNHAFQGWFTTKTGGTQVSGAYTPTANVTLYAHWLETGHTVTLTAGGTGTGAIKNYNNGTTGSTASTIAVAHGATVTISGDVLTVDGKSVKAVASSGSTFDGWSVTNGSAVNTDMTITANFKAGATVSAPSKVSAVIGAQTTFNAVTTPSNANVAVTAPAGWTASYGSGKVTLSIPATATAGDYTLNLTATATGYTSGQTTVTIHAAPRLVFQNTPVADCIITEATQ